MTKEAEAYWTSKGANNFPYTLVINGKEHNLIYEYQVPKGIGNWLAENNLIPNTGNLLDVASGSTTRSIFGESNTLRSYAIDISKELLAKNEVPEKNKTQMNIGEDTLPVSLRGQFSLATMLRCSRYLDDVEKLHVAHEIFSALEPGGTFVVMDLNDSPFGKEIGQTGAFDVNIEANILMNAGFKNLTHTECDVKVKDHKYGGYEYVLHKVIVAHKP